MTHVTEEEFAEQFKTALKNRDFPAITALGAEWHGWTEAVFEEFSRTKDLDLMEAWTALVAQRPPNLFEVQVKAWLDYGHERGFLPT